MPQATILDGDRTARNAPFAKAVRNFVDRAERHLPGVVWLVVAAIAAGVIMTVVGGFGTGAMPLGLRAPFWALLLGWSAVKWQAWFVLMVRKPADWTRAAAIGAVVLNLPLPLEIRTALAVFGIGVPMPAATVWAEALAISVVMFAVLALARRSRRSAAAGVAAPAATIAPDGLLARAGLASPAALRAILAEDHYCRVHVAGGPSRLVLHRFGDALGEVASLDGLRVHRGAWVADAAVTAAARDGRRWMLVLAGGESVAVSARYAGAVRQRGWHRRRAGQE